MCNCYLLEMILKRMVFVCILFIGGFFPYFEVAVFSYPVGGQVFPNNWSLSVSP